MDKAQTTILFLVMIGVMFFGQAISDFIKKKKSRSPQQLHRPAPRPKPHIQHERTVTVTPDRPAEKKISPASVPDKPEPAAEAAENHAQPALPDSDELRKAMIWSEILKRKF